MWADNIQTMQLQGLHGEETWATKRETFSYPLHSVKAQSSQQCSSRVPAAEVMQAEDSWMDYKRAGTPSDFLLCAQECQAQCLTSSMHSMYISEWAD